MMKAIAKKIFFAPILGIVCFGWGQSLNPVGSIRGVHDPVMIRQGNTYYLFHTGNNIPVKSSPDMVHWAGAGTAVASASWHQRVVPGNDGKDFWAPDISYRDGQYWLYYSVSTFGSRESAIGLVTSPSLAGPSWEDRGVVLTSPSPEGNYNAIDPNILGDTGGDVWMNWGSWWDGIFIIQLDPRTGKPLPSAAPVHLAGRDGSGIEGSFIIYARGFYHLFTSWDRCCQGANSTYHMRYGRATSVTGPYEDREGRALLSGGGTLLDDGSPWPGGHNAVYQADGEYYLVYHVYTEQGNTLEIRHLYFDGQDWPTLNPEQAVSLLDASPGSGSSVQDLHRSPLSFRFSGDTPPVLYDVSGRKTVTQIFPLPEAARFSEFQPLIDVPR